MEPFNIKTKTAGKCRVYPDNPQGPVPSTTSTTGCLDKPALRQWSANCAADYIRQWIKDNPGQVPPEEVLQESTTAYKRISDDAKDTGTDVHALCEQYLLSYHDVGASIELEKLLEPLAEQWKKVCMEHGDKPVIFAEEKANRAVPQYALFKSFRAWCEKEQIEPVHVEIKLHGDGYSGRCDLIAYRTDPKTKKRVLGLYDIKTGKGAYYPEWGLQLAAYAGAFEVMAFDGLLGKTKYPSEIGIIKLNKETLKCNFSETSRGTHFTDHRERLTWAFSYLKDFYWAYNDLATQFKELEIEAA